MTNFLSFSTQIKYKSLAFVLIGILLSGCQSKIKTADRPELSQSENSESIERIKSENTKPIADQKLSSQDLEKYAYELGLDPQTAMTQDDINAVHNRRKLRELERTLDSQKERQHYSKVIPYLKSDAEKITYLSINSIEGRQAWVNKQKLWSRDKSNKEFQSIVENLDIAIGMTADLVKKSWGNPESVDYSGNPVYKNERWKYIRDVASVNGYKREFRYVYFEGGRVVGWETE